MADDIILTQEEQEERVKKWLKENGWSIVAGVSIGLSIIFSVNYWREHQVSQSEQASALYAKVSIAVEKNANAKIDDDVATLKDKYKGTVYAPKAILLHVKQLIEHDLDKAAEELEWVLDNAEETGVQHTARLRLARIYIEQNKLDQATSVLAIKEYNGFDTHYHELRGDVAILKNEHEVARQYYSKAIETLSGDVRYKEILDLKISRIQSEEKK